MPMVWSVRNIVHSGILRDLAERGWQVHLITPEFHSTILDQPGYEDFALAASIQTFKPAPKRSDAGKKQRIRTILSKLLRVAYNRRNHIRSYPIYRRWHSRHNPWSRRMKDLVFCLLGELSRSWFIYARLFAWQEALYRRSHDLTDVREQLVDLQPDIVWSTVSVHHVELPYIIAAQDLGITTVSSILSFDNLTSRSILPLYDAYLVWNQRMRGQVLTYYPQIADRQVTVTGTPQFDFHRDLSLRWSREDTLRALRVGAGARYILYTTSSSRLAPEEPELVAQLTTRLSQDELLSQHWIVVRVHPLEPWDRWRAVLAQSSRVVLSFPQGQQVQDGGWSLPVRTDQALLVNSVLHADACVNIASTMALDAAVLDRPVIGIRFDREPTAPPEILYEEFDAEHYVPLVETGGIQVARSWDELLAMLRDAIQQPERYSAERLLMAEQEAGIMSTLARENVVRAIQSIADHTRKLAEGKSHGS